MTLRTRIIALGLPLKKKKQAPLENHIGSYVFFAHTYKT